MHTVADDNRQGVSKNEFKKKIGFSSVGKMFDRLSIETISTLYFII